MERVTTKDRFVVVLGLPASGKSTVAGALCALPGAPWKLLHGDDYREHGYEQALYVLMEDLAAHDGPVMVEGVVGFRLVRKLAQLGLPLPDKIVLTSTTPERRAERAAERGKDYRATDKGLVKVWRDCCAEIPDLLDRVVGVET
mgnify:CR=1 FL=1